MVFSSLLFLFRFLPLFLLVYFLAPRRGRNLVLLVFSLLFYAWGEPKYIVLMFVSTFVDYTAGRTIGFARSHNKPGVAKLALCCSMVVNLSLLGVFKYADFAIGIVNSVTPLQLDFLELALPIGISFYTFQTMSYTIDVYRGEVEVQKNIISFGAFVASFPQLIAGPVVRYQTVAEEMNHRRENVDDFAEGVRRFTIGLGKKVLIANQVGEVFNEIAATSTAHLSTLTAWVGVLAFTLQIYFDFSGYSDMAIGLGRMLGFHFLENFDHPYESKSVTEFWRRWHISMGTWFREYLYIPLGGNRGGLARQIRNIAIVWFLTGLWHGASWNFVIWGLYYGVILVIEKLVTKKLVGRHKSGASDSGDIQGRNASGAENEDALRRNKAPADGTVHSRKNDHVGNWFAEVAKHIYTLMVVMIGWAIFAYADMTDGAGYIKTLFGLAGNGLADSNAVYLLLTNLLLFVIAAVGSTSLVARVWKRIIGRKSQIAEAKPSAEVVRGAEAESATGMKADSAAGTMEWRSGLGMAAEWIGIAAIFVLSVAYLVNSSYNPFLYFRF